jgi:glycolate oxidase FAD binding subunit
LKDLEEKIRQAASSRTAIRFRGGGTKDFYGNTPRGEILDTRGYSGIVAYEATELVVTARCGTPLIELQKILSRENQFLPFEPPHFGDGATVGGCVAAGLSGPRRAAAGALRDYVLGAKIIDGQGRPLTFGGQVMKNVAGYDVSRLMAGSLGTLGLIAEVSIKVLPAPAEETTLRFPLSEKQFLEKLASWASQPLPVSATAWHDGVLRVRLSGSSPAVQAAAAKLGGETEETDWAAIREHRHPFFAGPEPLWRISLPAACAPLGLAGKTLIEWNGMLRWLKSSAGAAEVREAAKRAGGHATLFRAADKAAGTFAPLDPVLARLHREVKAAFDPAGIFNPGRLVEGL